jgi:hypothetical protein
MAFPHQVILEANRFGFLIQLAKNGGQARSPDLQTSLGMNSVAALWHHKRKLARAGLLEFDGPSISLTDSGRQALLDLVRVINGALGEDAQT